ncbi:MAG: phospholipase D-like domain-containing protein, partial [Candidatus Sericytochromatia bacterium]
MRKFFIVLSVLTIPFINLSCKKGGTVPSPEPDSRTPYRVLFTNTYKSLAVENRELSRQDPKNPDKEILKLIENAKESINIANYELESIDISNKLIEKFKKGISVKVVTETDHLKHDALVSLKAAGAIIKDDKREGYMHHKFMVIDNKIVSLGGINFTTRSLFEHNNDLLVIESTKLAENFNTEFSRLYDKGLFNGKDHSVPNVDISLPDITSIKTYFSPDGGTKKAIINELKNAKKSIKFMAFSFTEKDIASMMISKFKEKITVDGIFDTCQIDKYSQFNTLKSNKLNVLKDGNQALMHQKTMIVDDNTVITGSYNFSVSAETKNNEDCIIIKSDKIAALYVQEFERLKKA